MDTSKVVRGVLTDGRIISQDRSAEPVVANGDKQDKDVAPVRPSALQS